MRIVVAPDKFKGTLSASQAARAMAAGALAAVPSAEVISVPCGDGGEGFSNVLQGSRGGESHMAPVRDPLGRTVHAPIAYLPDGRVVIESAHACGLGLLTGPHALGASSVGVGDLIRHALEDPSVPSQIIVGVGGTASTDGGTGAAAAIGWRFLDRDGAELPPGGGALVRLHAIDETRVDPRVRESRIVVACDVRNALVGPRGAARVFGPQKGATDRDVQLLVRGLERLRAVVERELSIDVGNQQHGGAGGGLGAGLEAFFGAELTSGFDLVANETGLAEQVDGADVVVTGEGRIDESSLEGKVVCGVIDLARAAGARVVVIAGVIDPAALTNTDSEVTFVSLEERFGQDASSRAAECVASAVTQALTADPGG